MSNLPKLQWTIRLIEKPADIAEVEALQRLVWSGSETEIVPLHLLTTASHNGGLLLGAYVGGPASSFEGTVSGKTTADANADTAPDPDNQPAQLVGFVFGFPGLYFTPDGPRPKHCSHMLGIHPDYRNRGIGFALKRAQWQMVRHQGLDRITWTFDPLQSRNAHLNLARLGAVCNTYLQEVYGDMRDDLNAGLPSDRFQVDWWVNSQRVIRRLSRKARRKLDLAHFLAAGAGILNPTRLDESGFPKPPESLPGSVSPLPGLPLLEINGEEEDKEDQQGPILLVEVPSDFLEIKKANPALALEWRIHTREVFTDLFQQGYLVTDFVYLPGQTPRSFYVLSHGESTL